jgi:hypothetical protein
MRLIVPKNKTVCIGSRKFVEGDIIPPFVGGISFEEKEVEEIIKNNDSIEPDEIIEDPKKVTRRGPGRPRKNAR